MMGGAAKGNRYSAEAREERRKTRRASLALVAVDGNANGDDSRQSGYAPRELHEAVVPEPRPQPKWFGEGEDLRRYHRDLARSTGIIRAVTDNTEARRELEESYQKLEVTLASRALVPERVRQEQLELRSKTLGLERRIADQIDDNAAAATERQRDRQLADRDYETAVERQGEQLALAEAARKRAETKVTYAERIAQAAAEAEVLEQDMKRETTLQEIRKVQGEGSEDRPVAEPAVEDGIAPALAAELKEEKRRRAILESAAKEARAIRDTADGELCEEAQEQLDMLERAKASALRQFDLRQANLVFDEDER